jgi:hypothetical protein
VNIIVILEPTLTYTVAPINTLDRDWSALRRTTMTNNRWRLAGVLASLLIGSIAAAASAQSTVSDKAPAIRIGVAPSEAQLGQGNNAQGDYGSAIRNSIVLLMSGPAVDIIPLDSHLAMQLQAEAAQKQCDYILFSNVAVKRRGSGGFGKMMKMAAPAAGMIGMAGGMGGAVAGQAAGVAAMAAAQTAQAQAMSQLAAFNGQIKSKDDVTVAFRLLATGQDKPKLQNSLNAKANSDGEDVMTPLLLKAADAVLTEVSKK